MAKTKLDGWRKAVDREFHDQSPDTLDKIGQELQFELAKIIAEPLPTEFSDLLRELQEKAAVAELRLHEGFDGLSRDERSRRKNIPS